MIFQGLFNILDLYFEEIGEFYNHIDKYFREKISRSMETKDLKDFTYDRIFESIITTLRQELVELGFEQELIENYFMDRMLENTNFELDDITSTFEIYEKKFAPIVYEIFLEQVIDYIVESKVAITTLNLKSKGFFPTEFILELRNLKQLFQTTPDKIDNLKKYIHIQEKIIHKIIENKEKIEDLEELDEPRDKLQLLYSIFKVLDFFNLQKTIDFSHIKTYLQSDMNEWLSSVPLITLKNPDLYFCGIYLSQKLGVELDDEKVWNYLLDLYEENIDEFEFPLYESTDRIYYFLKATEMVKLWLNDDKVNEIIRKPQDFFETNFFINFETSQLVVILKIYNLLRVYQKIDNQIIKALLEEIELRITHEGIKQYRDGLITSEATYYVLFIYYMQNRLDELKDYENSCFLISIVSRIYRNLEFLDFTADTNYDLISELFYSCECLKLFNCIETKEMIVHLAKFLFPQEVVDKILNSKEIVRPTTKLRHIKVNRNTGETIY